MIIRLLILFLSCIILSFNACITNVEPYNFSWDMQAENHTGVSKNLIEKDGKHRGMSVFNWRVNRDTSLNQLIKNNVECIAVVPFLFQENNRTTEMRVPEKVGKWSNRDSSFMEIIESVHARGLHTMLKPHLWMREGWRSDITFESDEEWNLWFESYRKNILHYAILADSLGVELFCIGAELRSSVLKQADKWDQLISEVRSIYKGKLTYAANWDAEFKEIKFWDKLDLIGIQAYFPLTKNPYPELQEIQAGWKSHIAMLSQFSSKYEKQILFTEIGYRSDHTSTIEPWVWNTRIDSTRMSSAWTQNLAYEALFREMWNKKWFAGMYFWQWHNTSKEHNVYESRGFTPRYKAAENTMAKWYGRN